MPYFSNVVQWLRASFSLVLENVILLLGCNIRGNNDWHAGVCPACVSHLCMNMIRVIHMSIIQPIPINILDNDKDGKCM